jgi:hypothetical protein
MGRYGFATGLFTLAALAAGCDRDHDHDRAETPPPGPVVTFQDDFSGAFPGPDWEVFSGDPFTSSQEGNGAPGLILDPDDGPVLVRSTFVFGSEVAFTLSFDVAPLVVQSGSFFRFLVVSADEGFVDAAFELDPFNEELTLAILDAEDLFEFAPNANFDFIEFTVDADGLATWWINGDAFLTRSGFPVDLYGIDLETTGGSFTTVVVDNVMLTRP